MPPRAVDPTKYRINVVSFTVVREPGFDTHGRGRRAQRAKLDTPAAVAALARQLIPDDAREHVWAFLLDSQNCLIAAHAVSTGTLTASLVSAREVFAPALRVMGVAAVVLAHNHPSDDPTPSNDDLRLTRQLAQAAKLLDLKLLDHVIIGSGTDAYVSLAQRGEL